MAHALIIRGGTVLDGTGAPPMRADVAIDGDRVTAVGDLADVSAMRELDATGQAVTPGFVDLHTHLDAQIAWDPLMTSSSWHGVTTVLMGNCGVTFAPVATRSRAYLAELMESVEDIPREAILGGLPWDWETFPQYLDSVQRLNPALNVVGMVGHCAVRYHVMGERSMDEHARATPDELAAMRAIVAESVAGGAVGFSTSRILLHTVPDGRKVPGTYAPLEEYLAMADGMNDAGGGLFQGVLDFETKFQHELDLLRAMARRGGHVLFSGGVGNGTADAAGFWSTTLDDIRTNDGNISAIAMTRPSGSLMGLHQVPPVAGSTWRSVMMLPTLDQRLAALSDASTRADLVAEGLARGTWYDPRYIYPLGQGAVPEYHLDDDESVAVLAERAGVHPVEWIIERLLESQGRDMFNVWFFNRNRANLGSFLQLEAVCPGLGDAGAHAGQICDADAPTHYLSAWCRDRNLTSLADAVHRLSAKPAAVLGLVDRGTLRVGAYADVNVFDPESLQVGYPEYVHDFPNGKGRLRVGATGYAATLVNGEVVTVQGVNTGARPGRVLRDFRR
jgi:N-acyl-D-aspartate/D-glutamate deacylase